MTKLKVTKKLVDKLSQLTTAKLTEGGAEMNNPIPMEIPSGLNRPESINDKIRRMLRQELSEQMEAQGQETFEEADDFDIDDGFDVEEPSSPYELKPMQEEYLSEEGPNQMSEAAPPQPSAADPPNDQDPSAEKPETTEEENSTHT